MEGVRKSIKEFGFLKPVVITEDYQIVEGEHRALAMKILGRTEIQCYIATKITDDIKRRLARQTLNKLQGEHEIKLDANEMAIIFEAGQLDSLAELIAQDKESLQNILTRHKGITFEHDDNFDVNKALEDLVPETQLGDIWELGQHRIICADNSDKASLAKLVADRDIELVFADPPYNLAFDYNSHEDNLSNKDYYFLCKNAYDNIKRITSKVVITPGPRNVTIWYDIAGEPKDIGIWYKPNSSTYGSLFTRRLCEPILFFGFDDKDNKKRGDDYFNYSRSLDNDLKEAEKGIGSGKFAPAKPITLLTDIIKTWTEKGDIVCDPFLGSGTTLMAAEQTDRICYGIELDPHYVDVTIKRWEALTGQTAKKITLP